MPAATDGAGTKDEQLTKLMHRDGKPGVVGRGPNWLHGRVVDSHIPGDAEKHHGYGSPLFPSLDFPNRCLRIDGIDNRDPL